MAYFSVSFYSPALRRTVPCNVLMPTDKCMPGSSGYTHPAPCKTLYLLQGVFGSNTDWIHGTRVRSLAQAADLCIVMPAGENKFYANSRLSGDMFADFVTQDLISFTEQTFHVSPKREDRFIGGLSMGGFGALTNGLRHPELYAAILPFSAALIKNKILSSVDTRNGDLFNRFEYCTMFGLEKAADFEGSENDYEHLARAAAVDPSHPRPSIYMTCGTGDGLLGVNHAFRDLLLSLGYDLTYSEWAGGHDWRFWDESIEKAIRWISGGQCSEGISSGHVPGVTR